MGIRLYEHSSEILSELNDGLEYNLSTRYFNKSSCCYSMHKANNGISIKADYCIGIDWIGDTNRTVYVEPKINKSSIYQFQQHIENDESEDGTNLDNLEKLFFEIDYLRMLLQVTSVSESYNQVAGLLQIDWDAKQITIEQSDDKLTPFLVVYFLQTLKSIVRKGLKKSYYKVEENLNSRVKGKILVTQQIKNNVLKNKLTSTYCQYENFWENNLENQFLKKVLFFVSSYIKCNKNVFSSNYDKLNLALNYCYPAFTSISDIVDESDIKNIKYNPFYSDYKVAIETGQHILKRFAYNITKTVDKKVTSPPFWIDMPRLFELYVYSKMVEYNTAIKKEILYQFGTYGNSLDILVSKKGYEMVIDAKYKLIYERGCLHKDIRQVAGYSRLNKVRSELKMNEYDDRNIDCLIIYPDMKNGIEHYSLDNIKSHMKKIKVYHKVFKLGVKLPIIN